MKKIKTWIVDLAKSYWSLNWEAKIGILFLIPPIIGVFIFIFNLINAGFSLRSFSEGWNYEKVGVSGYRLTTSSDYSITTPAIPLYLGLMAIAGAYLIKGHLKKRFDK